MAGRPAAEKPTTTRLVNVTPGGRALTRRQGVTERDVDLAREMDRFFGGGGLLPAPALARAARSRRPRFPGTRKARASGPSSPSRRGLRGEPGRARVPPVHY
jgi:hypothetical protein